MAEGPIQLRISAEVHGAFADTRVGAIRRTLALWFLWLAGRLLRSRVDLRVKH
jgi:hypothetical protein